MKNDNRNEQYPWIDIARFFFCTCIIFMHIGTYKIIPEPYSYYLEKGIFRLAVPFFFVVSGFMIEMKIQSKNRCGDEIIKHYVTRLIYPYLFFETINVLLRIYSMIKEQSTFKTDILEIFKSLLFYPYGSLWYIWACIIGTLLLYPFIVHGKRKLAFIIGVILYGFALSCNNYYGLIPDNTFYKRLVGLYIECACSARNGVFVGFLLINIGMFCYDIKDRFDKHIIVLICAYIIERIS